MTSFVFREGFIFKVTDDQIISVTCYGREIAIGDQVMNKTPNFGIAYDFPGTVITIDYPGTKNLTSNIIGVDFDGDGIADAQMRVYELTVDNTLLAEAIEETLLADYIS